jgi:hypothetical protein
MMVLYPIRKENGKVVALKAFYYLGYGTPYEAPTAPTIMTVIYNVHGQIIDIAIQNIDEKVQSV